MTMGWPVRASAGQPDQQRIDVALRDRQPAAALADEEFFRLFGNRNDLGRDQRVMHQRIGLGQRRQDVERQQAGIAGAGAGQPYMARFEHVLLVVQTRDSVFECHACRFR